MRNKLKELGKIVRNPGWLCFVWFGMTAGISLLEAPVKFSAPSIAHAAYATTELLKLLLLLMLGFRAMMNDPTQAHPAP